MKRLLLILAAAAAMLAQGPGNEIPQYGGDGNPQHDGQPQWCQARDENGFKRNCGVCDRRCDSDGNQQESNKCKVYCRHGACRCHPSCITMNHHNPSDRMGE